MANKLMNDFQGEIPSDLDSYYHSWCWCKTANIILSVAFNKPAMPVEHMYLGCKPYRSQITQNHHFKPRKNLLNIFLNIYTKHTIGLYYMEDTYALQRNQNVKNAASANGANIIINQLF